MRPKKRATLALAFGRLITLMTLAPLPVLTYRPELSQTLAAPDKPVVALVLIAFFYYLSPRGS